MGINALGPVTHFPSRMPAYPHTKTPVQIPRTCAPASKCALRNPKISSPGTIPGAGPGTSSRSSFPGATAGSESEAVVRTDRLEVQACSEPGGEAEM